jgi:CheY-like chemotaxis protein
MTTWEPTILLVDDSKEDRILMSQALADAGLECKVDEASDGEEAELYFLRKLSEDAVPQLIILDLVLPKRSGLELMERWCAKGFTKLTRIIVLSSVLQEGEIAKLQQLGASQVFEKPLDLQEFLALGRHVKELASVSEASGRQAKPEH